MISEINVSKEVESYRKYLKLANFKKSTVVMYCRTVKKFLEKSNSENPEEALSQDHAQSYFDETRATKILVFDKYRLLSIAKIFYRNKRLYVVSKALTEAKKRNKITANIITRGSTTIDRTCTDL